MLSSGETILLIREIIHDFLPGSDVLLFGSHARGDNNPGSDYDLLIITSTPIDLHTRILYQARIRRKLAEGSIMADVILQTRSDFEFKKELKGHIVQAAVSEGIYI
jgi:uncharacterized protein